MAGCNKNDLNQMKELIDGLQTQISSMELQFRIVRKQMTTAANLMEKLIAQASETENNDIAIVPPPQRIRSKVILQNVRLQPIRDNLREVGIDKEKIVEPSPSPITEMHGIQEVYGGRNNVVCSTVIDGKDTVPSDCNISEIPKTNNNHLIETAMYEKNPSGKENQKVDGGNAYIKRSTLIAGKITKPVECDLSPIPIIEDAPENTKDYLKLTPEEEEEIVDFIAANIDAYGWTNAGIARAVAKKLKIPQLTKCNQRTFWKRVQRIVDTNRGNLLLKYLEKSGK